MKDYIRLSDHFTVGRLLRFAVPSIVMMVFTSIYSVVDGLFVSNFAGKEALAAINLVFPIAMMFGSAGFMLGTGGVALVAKIMGQGNEERANRLFSFIMLSAAVIGILLAAVAYAIMPLVLDVMGAQGVLRELCNAYALILFAALPFFIVQNAFQSFFIGAEKPHIGLAVTIGAGVTNMVLDAVFIAGFGWGISGAALATMIGQAVGAIVPLIFFSTSKTARLHFMRPAFYLNALGKTCVNGSSELVSNIAASVVSMLYNYQLMQLVGSDGVAAYSAIMYIAFIFSAMFFGFSMGTGPVISYHFGANNTDELKNLRKKCLGIVLVGGLGMLITAEAFAGPLVSLFVGYDAALYEMTLHGLRIYALSFLLCGFNIFGSAFFTALNNGVISAVISFTRTLLLETSTVMILPLFLGLDGVWCAIIVAEITACILTTCFLIAKRKKYNY